MKSKFFFFSAIVFSLILFSAKPRIEIPPGTVEVGMNLYFDKAEITNMNWMEYTYWNKKQYGKTSQEYLKSLPDTTVWLSDGNNNEPYVKYYYQHPAYRNYPVVGISYEQAVRFCQWRSDRVNEVIYLKKNHEKHTADKPLENIPEIFKYRLPTKEEWEGISSVGYTEKVLKKIKRKGMKKSNFSTPKKDGITGSITDGGAITTPVLQYYPNKFGIYNLLGNVAEMTQEKGIAKGGSFLDKEENVSVAKDFTYTQPTKWLGFRCVCKRVE